MIPRAPDHSRISITAKLVAYYRQFSDIPFAREVARAIQADHAFETIVAEHRLDPTRLREFAPIFEARYKSIVSLILKSGIHQVLELASGFSLRGLAMSRDPGLTYVESDLAGLQAEKQRLVTKLRERLDLEDHGNHHLGVANALHIDELRSAATVFRRDEQLVVVNEGLIQYFSSAERKALARNVRELLGDYRGGVWITPDFSLRQEADQVSEERKRFRNAVTGLTETKLNDAAFATPEEMDEFFRNAGFRAAVHSQVDETPVFSTIASLGLPTEAVERLRDRLKIWVLSAD